MFNNLLELFCGRETEDNRSHLSMGTSATLQRYSSRSFYGVRVSHCSHMLSILIMRTSSLSTDESPPFRTRFYYWIHCEILFEYCSNHITKDRLAVTITQLSIKNKRNADWESEESKKCISWRQLFNNKSEIVPDRIRRHWNHETRWSNFCVILKGFPSIIVRRLKKTTIGVATYEDHYIKCQPSCRY